MSDSPAMSLRRVRTGGWTHAGGPQEGGKACTGAATVKLKGAEVDALRYCAEGV